ncbi:MAG TPA: hypothetical protein VL286_05105 [Rhizomicrobium sp.]|nr:hypothetical protein [Rhizomicrobium sp.]
MTAVSGGRQISLLSEAAGDRIHGVRMVEEVRVRRAAVGVAVVTLHILVLLGFLAAIRSPAIEQVLHVREIIVRLLPPPAEPNEEERKPREAIPVPTFIVPSAPNAIIVVPELQQKPAAPQGDIGALGRYLYNCSGAYYEKLSPREKAHCLANQWEKGGAPNVMLGNAKPSPFDAVIAKRNAPFKGVEKSCAVDNPTSNLGTPCFDFGESNNPLNQFGH